MKRTRYRDIRRLPDAGMQHHYRLAQLCPLSPEGVRQMSILVKALVPVCMGLMIAAAQAQLLPTWETRIVLTRQDLDMIHAAVTQKVHGKPVGTTAAWSNPASENSGSIRLVKRRVLNNQQCEDIAYTVRSDKPPVYTEHYHFTSCLQPDGTWKIA
jgi:surface antigen